MSTRPLVQRVSFTRFEHKSIYHTSIWMGHFFYTSLPELLKEFSTFISHYLSVLLSLSLPFSPLSYCYPFPFSFVRIHNITDWLRQILCCIDRVLNRVRKLIFLYVFGYMEKKKGSFTGTQNQTIPKPCRQ